MSSTVLIGLVATCCSTLALLPQVVKTWRTRSTADISVWTFSTVSTASVLWVIYGWLRGDVPVVVANTIVFFLATTILWLKVRHP